MAYAAIAAVAYWPIAPLAGRQLPGCGCGDIVQEVWFLGWTAHALSHGANPFFSNFINYPSGVNLMANTSMPLLGLLATPITLHFGPIAAYNFLLRLSFMASATSMMCVARRFTRGWIGPCTAGLLYGFSPYMIGEGNGHLFLTFVPLPPLILLATYELFVHQTSDRKRWGLLLGVFAAAQFFISMEVLAATTICVLAVLAVVALRRWPLARRRLRSALPGLLWSAVIFLPLVSYPLWFFFFGQEHIRGAPQPAAITPPYRSDLFSPLVPTFSQLFAPHSLQALGSQFVAGDLTENGAYLGLPLICAVVASVIWLRKYPVVRLLAVLGGAAFVLSLGARLEIGNHDTGIPLPFLLLKHLMFFDGLLAARFSLYVQLAAALIIAIALDRVLDHKIRLANGSTPFLRKIAFVLGTCLVITPLIPRFPYATTNEAVPSYFTSSVARHIPEGSLVLVYPYDLVPDNQAMLWQSVTNFDFRIIGGEATTPAPNGDGTSVITPLAPTEMRNLFLAAMLGATSPVPAPPMNADGLLLLRQFLQRWKVPTIVVDPIGADPQLALGDLTKTLGCAPKMSGGVDIWYGVQSDLEQIDQQLRTATA